MGFSLLDGRINQLAEKTRVLVLVPIDLIDCEFAVCAFFHNKCLLMTVADLTRRERALDKVR